MLIRRQGRPQLNLNSDIQPRYFPVAPIAQNPLLEAVLQIMRLCLTSLHEKHDRFEGMIVAWTCTIAEVELQSDMN